MYGIPFLLMLSYSTNYHNSTGIHGAGSMNPYILAINQQKNEEMQRLC